MWPRRTRLEQATLTSEDHDAGERHHHDRYTEENPNGHGPCPGRTCGCIVTPVDVPARSAWHRLEANRLAIVGLVPAVRPERTLASFGLEAGHYLFQIFYLTAASFTPNTGVLVHN